MFLKLFFQVPIVFLGFLRRMGLCSDTQDGLSGTFGAYLRIYGRSLNEYDVAPLSQAENLLNSSFYNSSLFNFLYTFGFNGKTDGPSTTKVLEALLKMYDRNTILLDWQQEASSITTLGSFGYIISYLASGLQQSAKVGLELGRALDRMSEEGFKLNETHAMGHSLGAHLFGDTGRHLRNVGKSLSRITGCDPAGAFFDRYAPLMRPLDSTCADFVDITFTDPGGYAMNSSQAHLTVWANFGNFIYGPEEDQVQPGCPIGDYEMFSQNDLCSHNRCLDLWIQTWAGTELKADKAEDYWTWNYNTEQGIAMEFIILGDRTQRTAFGNYYMNTTSSPPYQIAD